MANPKDLPTFDIICMYSTCVILAMFKTDIYWYLLLCPLKPFKNAAATTQVYFLSANAIQRSDGAFSTVTPTTLLNKVHKTEL